MSFAKMHGERHRLVAALSAIIARDVPRLWSRSKPVRRGSSASTYKLVTLFEGTTGFQ